jgi:hypothetical protein
MVHGICTQPETKKHGKYGIKRIDSKSHPRPGEVIVSSYRRHAAGLTQETSLKEQAPAKSASPRLSGD